MSPVLGGGARRLDNDRSALSPDCVTKTDVCLQKQLVSQQIFINEFLIASQHMSFWKAGKRVGRGSTEPKGEPNDGKM